MTTIANKEVFDIRELSAYLGIGQNKCRAMAKSGALPRPFRAGRKDVWFKDAIDAVVSSWVQKSGSEPEAHWTSAP